MDGFVLVIRIVSVILAAFPPPAQAQASVTEVLQACARSAAGEGQGIDAAFCEWHALPCACKVAVNPAESPRWCYPDPMDHAEMLAEVVAELASVPGDAPAETAVPPILARLYPCDTATAAGDPE
ncbi:MAG: hypothetical protein KJO38_08795 [Gammaproteobacteria bacterium]|nr:hypothetical protein [Gammaproteobacteria bacterium]